MSQKSRRITEQLKKYWKSVKKDNPFPPVADIHPADLSEIWQDCFISALSEHGYHYIFLGGNIRNTFSGDLSGEAVMTLTDNLRPQYDKVSETLAPVEHESEFQDLNGNIVKYRLILLPLGPEENVVDHILGGMRYKIYESA